MCTEHAKILVVDDDPNNLQVLSNLLKKKDYEVLFALDGDSCLQCATTDHPALILLDVIMPGMDGFETCSRLKASEVTQDIPVIFMTALTEAADKVKGFECGAVDYIIKPVVPEELLARVHIHLSMQRLCNTLNTEVQELSQQHAFISKQMQDLRLNLSRILPHELRTPLNAILGFSRFLISSDRQQFQNSEDILSIRTAIYDSALRLQRLIENYLLYANLLLMDADKAEPSISNGWQRRNIFRPEPYFVPLIDEKSEKMKRKDDIFLDLANARIQASEKSIIKIVEEVFDNALKFSEPGTPVHITTTTHEHQWTLMIRDQGRGMTPEQIANIGAYVQFEREWYEQQGSGLGLTLAMLLTNMNGGALTIESIPKHGTIVTITFPEAGFSSSR